MKKILFIFILFFNIVPNITKNSFSFLQINTVKAQNTDYILMNYLTALYYSKPSNSTEANFHTFNILPSGCGCMVREVDRNGNTVADHHAVAYQNSPGYQYFQVNGTINTTPPNNGDNDGENEDENYEIDDNNIGAWLNNFIIEREIQTLSVADLQYAGFGFEGIGPNNQGPDCRDPDIMQILSDFEFSTFNGPINKNITSFAVNQLPQLPCANKLLIGGKIVSFTSDQLTHISKYNFDGSKLLSVTYDNFVYTNTLQYNGLKLTQTVLYVDNYCPAYQTKNGIATSVSSSFKFVRFDELVLELEMNNGNYDGIIPITTKLPNGDYATTYTGIPDNKPGISFSIPTTNTVTAVIGDLIMSKTKSGVEYCKTLTEEDIKLNNSTDRDKNYVPPTLRLDHYINVPDWVKKFIEKIAPKLNDCEVNYINVGLDALHLNPKYINNTNENSKAIMETETLAYDILFGVLYCATNEEAAKGKSCAKQEGLGIMHELIASIDVAQMRDGIVNLVDAAGNLIVTNVKNMIDGVKDIVTQYVSTGDVDFKKIAKDFIRKNIALADSAYNKAAEIANHFKKMYFTGCGTEAFPDGTTADMCCYRDGELTAMVIPIILTAGDYAVVKLTGLAAKYGIGSTKAIRLLDDAAKSGATIIDNIAGETKIIEQASIGVDELETVIKKENINDVKFKRDDNYFEPYPTNVNPPIIGGQKPINYEFANKVYHTKSGYDIPFDADGFPDMNAVSQRTVRINNMSGVSGGINGDFSKANFQAFGVADPNYHLTINNGQYANYTWHHHQDTKSMMLVPKAVNNPGSQFGGVPHTGGAAIVRHINNGGAPFNFLSPPLK